MGKKSAVCIVRHDYYPDGHVSRDAEALAAAGYATTVVALRRRGEAGRDALNGVRIHRLPVEHHRGSLPRYGWEYLRFFVLAFLTVSVLHLRRRFAVIEADNMPDVLVFTAALPKLLGARVILYNFDQVPELLTVVRGWKAQHPLVRLAAELQRVSSRFADRLIITTETHRQISEARGATSDKVRVVLNCPNETAFGAAVGHHWQAARDSLHIATHGTILERFGIQVLIDALPAVAAAVPRLDVHIYGEGEYRQELETRARRVGVADHVHFHGFVPQERLVALLEQADVGYVGMLCDLMLSNKLMEYAALGTPIVAARWPTYEHYFPESAITYFRPGDAKGLAAAIIGIYGDQQQARRKAEQARALYEGYRWARQREVYLGVYAELLGGAGGRSGAT